jgi:hypothetical protein
MSAVPRELLTHPKDLPPILTADYLRGKLVHCPHCQQVLPIIDVGERQTGVDPHDSVEKGYYIVTLSDGGRARMWESL